MKKKKFRLNVIITYYKTVNINFYRPPLHVIVSSIAWLHRLDYAISVGHLFVCESHSEQESITEDIHDLIYFRSTESTKIEAKDLRMIIDCLFGKSLSWFYEGVDVGYQLQKALPQYPFPKDFYRPLNYPYMEVHSGDTMTLCILESALE